MLIVADACRLPLRDGCIQTIVTSPPYWGLRDYGIAPRVWGPVDCPHEWGASVAVNATNHTDKRRWNHTRNGRDEEQPTEKRVAWLRSSVDQGAFCGRCGAWRGSLGLEPTPELYVKHITDVFREVWRVMKDDGTLWLNLGDCYATGAGAVGEHLGGGEQGARWKGETRGYRGDRLVNTNSGTVARKKTHGYRGGHPAEMSGKHGPRIAAMGPMTQPNRMPIAGLKPKDLVGIPWRVAFALQADGWYLRSDIIWAKPNPMPESVTDRPTKAHEYVFLLTKSARYYYDAAAIAEPVSAAMLTEVEQGYDGLGLKDYEGAGVQNPSSVKARIIDGARRRGKALTSPRNDGNAWNENHGRGFIPKEYKGKHSTADEQEAGRRMLGAVAEARAAGMPHDAPFGLTRNKRSVWTVPTMPYAGAHFATFPEKLIEPCILAGCPAGGLVFDPFVGSGTVGAVAERLGRRWVGTDLSYQHLAAERTAQRGLRFEMDV